MLTIECIQPAIRTVVDTISSLVDNSGYSLTCHKDNLSCTVSQKSTKITDDKLRAHTANSTLRSNSFFPCFAEPSLSLAESGRPNNVSIGQAYVGIPAVASTSVYVPDELKMQRDHHLENNQ